MENIASLKHRIVKKKQTSATPNWSTGLRRVGRAGPTPAEEQLHILRNLDKEVVEESRKMEVEEAEGA